ncbi:hypothetical protein MKZ38_000813 [Zalerion maritima]|uniref:Uncharacterized protein n=1 Tax=Zalerion maritima TaxID=339359 RepID=A0AAD5RFG6_9PEZI|nr:hypothetical protein MKZ38_000813 [Zalerion maritima]
MKDLIPLFLRDIDPSPLVFLIHVGSQQQHNRISRRGLSPGTLAILIIIPVVATAFIFGTVFVVILRRKRRKRLHQNSPTTSAVRNSLEEDLESYRLERERMGDVMGAGVSQEDLEHQLRITGGGPGSARESMMSLSPSMTTISGPNSRSASKVRGEVDGWYAPPTPHSPRRGSRPNSWVGPNSNGSGNGSGRRRGRGPPGSKGPSRPSSRPASRLRNSIQQIDEGAVGDEKLSENKPNIEQIAKTDHAVVEHGARGFYEPDAKTALPIGKDPVYR